MRTRERIFTVAMDFQKLVDCRRLKEGVARQYRNYLVRIALWVDGELDDVQAVSRALADPRYEGQLRNLIAAYNHYRRVHGVKEELGVKRDRRRKLPILTPESTLKASLVIPRALRWQAYFRLRYETGPRPSEPFTMRKQDVNFDRQLARFKTLKGSGETLERELPISPLTCELLRTLTAEKHPEDYVFTKPLIPDKPLDYKDAQDVMNRVRKQLKQAGYNVQGLCLYVYRHAFATRLYHATKDLPLVSRSMGHNNLETTMLYIHMHPDTPRRYDVKDYSINDAENISLKIAEGWEVALQTAETVWFKRPRWVP